MIQGQQYIHIQKNEVILNLTPGGSEGKASACRRPGLDPWVRKIPWRRKLQPTRVFLPGKSHGQRSMVDYSPWNRKELDTNEHTQQQHQCLEQPELMIFEKLVVKRSLTMDLPDRVIQ